MADVPVSDDDDHEGARAPAPVASSSAPELLAFACPRCGTAVEERLYGPCADCRAELRATVAGEQRAVDAPAYEPKLNVTPNAVALKE
jgi:hypothetical protein